MPRSSALAFKRILPVLAVLVAVLDLHALTECIEVVLEHRTWRLDVPTLEALHAHAAPLLDRAMLLFTDLGDAALLLPLSALLALALFLRKRRVDVLFLLSSVVGVSLLTLAGKLEFARARPHLWPALVRETDFGFPSGHAALSSALALALIALSWDTRLRLPALLLCSGFAALVALSRLYLGVHYPSDVLASLSLSLLWVSLMAVAFGRARARWA